MNKSFLLAFIYLVYVSALAQSPDPTRQRMTREGGLPVYKETRPAVLNNRTSTPASGAAIIAGQTAITPSQGYEVNADSAIHIAVMLPFDYAGTSAKIYGYMKDKELNKGELYAIKENTREALDFYEGLQYAINHSSSKQKVDIHVFDTENNDSVVKELLKTPAFQRCAIVIGPGSLSEAKLVATSCHMRRVVNIQPFIASKSVTSENPFFIRFMPTIDAHLQKEYEMVMDSFSDKNIIIYTTRRDRDLSAARQLEALFESYNSVNTNKVRYTLVNMNDSTVPAAKRTLSAYLLPKELNVVLMTCYDEAQVNSVLRATKENMVIFGMPTWIDGDQIRVDYLSKSQPYYTDNFFADTSKVPVRDFTRDYQDAYNHPPTRYSYMGYDAMTYLSQIFDKYGPAVVDAVNKESYEGLGYSFHISPVIRTAHTGSESVINYYANTAMHLFQVRDYKIWPVR